MHTTLLLIGALLLAGCSADMVVGPGSDSRSVYGPVNQASQPGIIKYLNEGAASVRAARRENAYHQMYNACAGKYKIIQEGPKSEGGVVVPAGHAALFSESEYMYIEFECIAG